MSDKKTASTTGSFRDLIPLFIKTSKITLLSKEDDGHHRCSQQIDGHHHSLDDRHDGGPLALTDVRIIEILEKLLSALPPPTTNKEQPQSQNHPRAVHPSPVSQSQTSTILDAIIATAKAPLSSPTTARIVKSKPIIQALQSWVLQEPITNLSIAIKSLQALNCLPWNINLLQEHKLGRMLKKATSLSDDPGYQKELYTLFESISTLIDAETIKDKEDKYKDMQCSTDILPKTQPSVAIPFDPFEGIKNSSRIENKRKPPSPLEKTSSDGQPQPLLSPPSTKQRSPPDIYVEIVKRVKKAKPKKKVSFVPDHSLCKIYMFPYDPNERKNVYTSQCQNYPDFEKSEALVAFRSASTLQPQTSWKTPSTLLLSTSCLTSGGGSIDKAEQEKREKYSLSVIFIDSQKCPPSPQEPSIVNTLHDSSTSNSDDQYAHVRCIPLHAQSNHSGSDSRPEIDDHTLDSLLGSMDTESLFQDYADVNSNSKLMANHLGHHHLHMSSLSYQDASPAPYAHMAPKNVPLSKFRKVKCHFWTRENPSACQRGDSCTFLH